MRFTSRHICAIKRLRTSAVIAVTSLLMTLPLLAGCRGGSDDVAVPRPKAYPRLAVVGDTYRAVPDGPSGFVINADALVSEILNRPNPGPYGLRSGVTQWITVEYPVYHAKIYYTFTPVDNSDRESVMANRMERIGLNFSGVPVRTTDVTSVDGTLQGYLMTTGERCAFPVQFLMSGDDMVVSGSLFMPSMTQNPDSVSPAIGLITRDILYGLGNLRPQSSEP